MEPKLLPFGSFTRWIINQVVVSGLRMEHQVTAPNDGRIGGIGNGNKVDEMLKKMKMGKNSKERFKEMNKDGKIQDGLRSEMV